jgi:TonB-dependent starch-binding outer membrane protein SusC
MRNLIKKTKLIFTLSLSLFFLGTAMAQEIDIQGKVSDSKTGDALPGVNIVVKSTTRGTTSDIDGNYKITVEKGSVLVFSFIGYKNQELPVDIATTLNVALESDVAVLDEIVVIGYGQVKKSDATGSVVSVSSKDFNKGVLTSPQDLLIGKATGVVITNSGGAPGSGATIRIRGGSSLNANNDPLIIIDGVPIDNKGVAGSANILSFVNPNDIESYSILKDASATAIYGSRASNGVIIITTKKGKTGGPMKLSYDGSLSVGSAMKFMDVYSGDELRQIAYEHGSLFNVNNFSLLGSENTDWQKEIFRTAVSTDHNLTLSGAYKSMPYRVSGGYTQQNGILKNTDLKRFIGSLSLDPTFFKDKLKVSLNLKGMNTDHNYGDDGAIGSAINMDPTQPVFDNNPSTGGYYQWSSYGANLGTANPVEQLMDVENKSNVIRVIGNLQLDYKLPYITGLRANLNLATDYTESIGRNKRPTTAPSVLTTPFWGKVNRYKGTNRNNLLEFYLNYNKDLPNINSKIDATAGYSWQHFQREEDNITRGYSDAMHQEQKPTTSPFITENFLVSFFGRLNYTLADKYMLTGTLRNDGSSRFIGKNQWGLFPSAAFAWKIKEEGFLKGADFLSNLKVRLGWGITGQQDVGSDYPAQAVYIRSAETANYPIDGQFISSLRPNAYDPNIKWEETTTQNIGLDFGFANDRISGSIDLYKRVTDDLLNQVTIPSGSNFSNTLLTNVGSLENKGIEISLNLVPISTKDMSLNFGFNFTYNKNEITKLLLTDDPSYIGILYGDAMTGQKQVTRVGYPAYSFFVNKQVYDNNGNPIEGLYVDLGGKGGSINGNTSNQYIYHNPVPDYLLGFSARFTYKNFDLSGSARASIGNYVYNAVAAGSSYDQMYQIGYWKNFPKFLSDTKFVKRQFTSDYFVENASFFKLDNLSAGYNFGNIYRKLNMRLSFTVQNVLTVTKYKGLDPEIPYKDGVPGVDNNFYPRARTFVFGVSLSY